MRIAYALKCSLLICFTLTLFADENQPEKNEIEEAVPRFEYKMSFKGPHLIQSDGSIPFWDHAGNALATNDFVRITPSIKSQKGRLWCNEKNTHPYWEVEFSLRINGRRRIGADGLAFWYTSVKGGDGPVFGSSDSWNGLAIILDSFDNDQMNNNPYIMAMGNDGSLTYNHDTDGSRQQLSGCQRDFRNKQFPIRIKVRYFKKTLTVLYHNGNNEKVDYETCFSVPNVNMPKQGYFGLSAATGDVADDHDVLLFETHSLRDAKEFENNKVLKEDDLKKFQSEFQQFDEKLQKAKDEYRKVNPDKFTPGESDAIFTNAYLPNYKSVYETQETRELKQIYEGQTQIQNMVRYLDEKFTSMLKTNEQLSRKFKDLPTGSVSGNAGGDLDSNTIQSIGNINNQQILVTEQLKQLKDQVTILSSKNERIFNELFPLINEKHQRVHESLNQIKSTLSQKGGQSNDSCASGLYITILIIIQTLLGVLYVLYQQRANAQAKKFY